MFYRCGTGPDGRQYAAGKGYPASVAAHAEQRRVTDQQA